MFIDKIFKYKNIKKGRRFIFGIILSFSILWGGSYLAYQIDIQQNEPWYAFPLTMTLSFLFMLGLFLTLFNYDAWTDKDKNSDN